jgi:hypothetical protein
MKNTWVFVLCLLVAGAFAACGRGELPQEAKDWLKGYEAAGNESVEIAKKAKAIDTSDAAAVQAHNEAGVAFTQRMQSMMEQGEKIGNSLNDAQKKAFLKETDKIKERIQAERSTIRSGE